MTTAAALPTVTRIPRELVLVGPPSVPGYDVPLDHPPYPEDVDPLEGPKRYILGVRAGVLDPAPEAFWNRTGGRP